jgi:putative colanic acid biosynthesis acetyltransferase WcaF
MNTPSKTDASQLKPAATEAHRHRSPWTTRQKIGRLLWGAVQATLFQFSPHNFYRWRAMLLRLFGAHIADHVLIRPTARFIVPWHVQIGEHSSIGDFAIIYSLGRITIGKYATISQYAHLCAGSHDARTRAMTLTTAPITIGDDVWIAADAFVGPDVTIGDRSIVGARASVFSDVPPDVIVGGNPAKMIKPREFSS